MSNTPLQLSSSLPAVSGTSPPGSALKPDAAGNAERAFARRIPAPALARRLPWLALLLASTLDVTAARAGARVIELPPRQGKR